jgi:hypothetical protein
VIDGDKQLAQRFHESMLEIYDIAGQTTGYWAHYFRREVRAKGGLPVARRLLSTKGTSDGFERLKAEHALHLSVEALVLRPEFRALFRAHELATARERLEAFGYRPVDLGVGTASTPPELRSILDAIDGAGTQEERWDFRDGVVSFGADGREAMREWLSREHFSPFALSVLERLAATDPSSARVIDSYATTGGNEHKLAIAALARIRKFRPGN